MFAEINPRRFKIAWIVAGVLVLPLSIALAVLVLAGMQDLAGRFFDTSAYFYWDDRFEFLAAIFGLVNGLCIGILQQGIVRRYLRVDLAGWWKYSAIGGLCAAVFAFFVFMRADELLSNLDRWVAFRGTVSAMVFLQIYLCVLACVQTLVLRRHTRNVWCWLAVHLAAATLAPVSQLLLTMTGIVSVYDAGVPLSFSALLAASICTGFMMLRLMLPCIRANKAKRGDFESR